MGWLRAYGPGRVRLGACLVGLIGQVRGSFAFLFTSGMCSKMCIQIFVEIGLSSYVKNGLAFLNSALAKFDQKNSTKTPFGKVRSAFAKICFFSIRPSQNRSSRPTREDSRSIGRGFESRHHILVSVETLWANKCRHLRLVPSFITEDEFIFIIH